MRLQEAQDCRTVVAAPHGIAQRGAKALLAGRIVQKGLHVGGQHVDDFFKQVVADQAFAAMQGLGQGLFVSALAGRQLPEAQAGHPAVAALDQIVQGLAPQAGGLAADYRQRLFGGKAQVLLVEFDQLPRQAQARQVPVRALAAGDQQHQAGGR